MPTVKPSASSDLTKPGRKPVRSRSFEASPTIVLVRITARLPAFELLIITMSG